MSAVKPTNPHADAWKAFRKQTGDHELVVIHDDGLHRHLRVQAPGTRIWSWDIVTWPDHLATSGDVADGFMFMRTSDMLGFFTVPDHRRGYYSDGAPCIDVHYWAEKLCGGRSLEVKTYDSQAFLRQVREHLEENEEIGLEADAFRARQIALLERIRRLKHRGVGEDTSPTVAERLTAHWAGELTSSQLFDQFGLTQAQMDQLREEFDHDKDGQPAQFDLFDLEWSDVAQTPPAERREEILRSAELHDEVEYTAHTWLAEHEQYVGTDTFEWDLREYDFHFVLTCYAIDHAVQLYRRHCTDNQEDS